MKNYAIKNIPNSPNGKKAIALLKNYAEWRYDMKGRGCRFRGSVERNRDWDTSLPHEFAARFTLYGYQKTPPANYDDENLEKDYWRYCGLRNGKPVIRQMTHDYPCKTLRG